MRVEEGDTFEIVVSVSDAILDAFSELSGDRNPLHMSDSFAQSRGFSRRVAHGALLAAYVSQMVGMHCPGEDALLHSLTLKFLNPVYSGDTIHVTATVDRISQAAKALVLRIAVTKSGMLCAKGTAQVGSTCVTT